MKSHLVYSFELQAGDKIFEDHEFTKVINVVHKKMKVVIHLSNGKTYTVDRKTSFNKVIEL